MTAPLIWALTGRNAGDNAQVSALAQDVAAACQGQLRTVPLRFNLLRELPNAWLGPTRASLAGPLPAALEPAALEPGGGEPEGGEPGKLQPRGAWPDMVIGIGRRAVPVARWIKARSNATRLVWLGRPRLSPAMFDLVLTTPQYHVPDGPTVLRLSLPYGPPSTPARPEAPLMLVGGQSWSDTIDAACVERLAACARRVAPGALRITTSPRTPPGVADMLAQALPEADIYRFGARRENPYQRWLSEASLCIVTGDSVSLLADAVQTGAPTYVIPATPGPLPRGLAAVPGPARRWFLSNGNRALLAPPPDPQAVLAGFHAAGVAAPAPEGTLIEGAQALLARERADARARIAAMLRPHGRDNH